MENNKINFALPEDITVIDVIDKILKNNGLEESDDQFVEKEEKGIEPRLIIVRDAAMALFEKKITEEKLAEVMAKHLECSKETAQKIIDEIKQKLLPYARIAQPQEGKPPSKEQTDDISDQQALIEKIKQGIPDDKPMVEEAPIAPPPEPIKKVVVADVEKNADLLKKQREETSKLGTTGGELQRKNQSDKYREPVE